MSAVAFTAKLLLVAYDQRLAERLRALLADEPDIVEMRAFGGLAFMASGNMAVSASGQGGAMVRCDPNDAPALHGHPGVTEMQMRGRPMTGWLHLDDSATASDADLAAWVARGLAFARSLPPK